MQPLYPPIQELPIVFEDEHILIVDKPCGMLSQPGKHEDNSVLTRVLHSERVLHGPVLVHRLDMDTSGLLLMAKSRSTHRVLQQQFERRQIHKRYQARLSLPVSAMGGVIQLPIRLDVDNRPTQVVCHEFGKPSTTLWRRTHSQDSHAVTFYPITGRTHQLRLHAAAGSGLNNPIQGDRLYGRANESAGDGELESQSVSKHRMMLHADLLQFVHPVLDRQQCVVCKAPF